MNRLGSERSSYLRSAAHQPVAWQPWSEAAFAQAKAEDKPILLDIGAVWCHWCHVMDRESYEDKALADVINQRFVAIKVDRDERPDVDTRYQKAIQAMTGQGGWPLTAFLLPDGRCFYGGTYFPPVDAHGRPSFRRVLEGVSEAYATRRDEVLANANELTTHLARPAARRDASAWSDADIEHAVGHMQETHDAEHGGFGTAPKFPHPAAHDLLLARGGGARDITLATLAKMRAGGVFDQLGGGFHRYSVDAEWIVPHFEQMLYDNAALLRNYVRADRIEDARAIKGFLRDVLQQPDGGFGGSRDADIDLEDDGDFFTWTLDELRAACSNEDVAKLMARHFGVREKGDMHHDPRRCVLRIQADAPALAAALSLPLDRVEALLARGRDEMRAARAKRQAPFVDPIRYTSWNAMAIQALLEMGGRHEDAEADTMALRALDLFLERAFDARRGWTRTLGGHQGGWLDDHAQMLDALLEAHVATGADRYLVAARATADLVLAHFAHPDGGFADRAPALAGPGEAATLAQLDRPIQDAPTPSANGVACRALLRLAEATGDARYHDAATAALRALAGDAMHLGVFGGALLLAMQDAIAPPPRVVVKGTKTSFPAFRATVRRHARPGATIAGASDPGVPEEARAFPGEGAMVCVGMRCLAPARTATELTERLREA